MQTSRRKVPTTRKKMSQRAISNDDYHPPKINNEKQMNLASWVRHNHGFKSDIAKVLGTSLDATARDVLYFDDED